MITIIIFYIVTNTVLYCLANQLNLITKVAYTRNHQQIKQVALKHLKLILSKKNCYTHPY
jgi:hypothetical protein